MTCGGQLLGMTRSYRRWLSTKLGSLVDDLCQLLLTPVLVLPLPRHCQCSQCYCWLVTNDRTMTEMTGSHHTSSATNAGLTRTLTSRSGASMTADPGHFCRTPTLLGVPHCRGHCWSIRHADRHVFRHPLMTMTRGCARDESPYLVVERHTRTVNIGMVFLLCAFSGVWLGGLTVRTPVNRNTTTTKIVLAARSWIKINAILNNRIK